jgi:hypothetical protein
MSDWHDCCNTRSREEGAFRVLCYSARRHLGGDFGCWRSGERQCGDSLAFSVAPNAALSRPLYYDRRRLDHRLAEGPYAGSCSLIFLSGVSPERKRHSGSDPGSHGEGLKRGVLSAFARDDC